MRTIQKGIEPSCLTTYRRKSGANYDQLPDPCRDALRRSLVAEQRGLCCYCQSRIQPSIDGKNGMKIEHWRSRSRVPEQQLDYNNMFGACRGGEGRPREDQHCDTRKGSEKLCFSVCDPNDPIENKIKFLGDGRIKSDDPKVEKALNNTLNLNWSGLVNGRKAMLDALNRASQNENFDDAEELKRWDGSTAGDLPKFAQVVVFFLQRRIRKSL